MATGQSPGEQQTDETRPPEGVLTATERIVMERELGWCKTWEVVRATPGRKLARVITPQDEEQYYTLVGDPEPRLVFHEPVRFVVTVSAAKGPDCRAGHKVDDRWEFDWRTPAGMCGAVYHAIYPVLHGLMLTSGRYEGPAAEKTEVSCPDQGWLTFRIERHRWTPAMWDTGDDAEGEP